MRNTVFIVLVPPRRDTYSLLMCWSQIICSLCSLFALLELHATSVHNAVFAVLVCVRYLVFAVLKPPPRLWVRYAIS